MFFGSTSFSQSAFADVGTNITNSVVIPLGSQVNVAIGLSGVSPTKRLQGEIDAWGRDLLVTEPAFCDEVSAASGLIMHKSGKTPVILFNGLDWEFEISNAENILRKESEDMFR